ncbi:MAG: replicative DNA helicase [Elusimicrobiales bacterium]|uniref:replicative DNA helicase n=1 Tax=Candidatus Avelusimicrobium sp. TaxID=3048833 RepID=UPI001B75D6AE|nr:replicative DNA helicase [Elusimicrobiaceae bacterium]MDO5764576.1 replicative DNA helicase [Elusimicrobiales bacterium]
MASNLLEERIPPQAIDAEMAVLGSMLLDAEAVETAFEILKPEHFYKDAHQKIFAAMKNLVDRSQAIDIVTLSEELKRSNLLTQLGGEIYLTQLVDKVATSAHVKHYAEIVYKKFVVRDLIRTATGLVQRCYKEEDDDPQTLIDSAADQIYKLSQKQRLSGFVASKDLAPEVMDILEKAIQNKNAIQGVPTGLDAFDHRTGGLRKSDLIILGARPSQGKTALALNIAHHACVECKIPVAFFSLEMGKHSIFERMLGAASMVEIHKLRTGWFDRSKWADLTRELGRLASAPFFIDDTSGISITELRMRSRRLASELKKQGKELGLIVIDYLQLIRGGERRVESRQQEVSEISRMLKDLARTLNVPVLALSQLSRKNEDKSRSDNKPQLSDLRESGSIEQDADVVALIHRDWYYKRDDESLKNKATLIIAKQRNGPVGDIDLAFFGEYALFTNPAPEHMEVAQDMGGDTVMIPE